MSSEIDRRANEVWWTTLPAGAESPISVFVNGTELKEGDGITVRDGRIYFDTPLHARPAMGFGRQFMLALGIGVYGDLKGDTIDIQFMRNGVRTLISERRPPATGPLTE